MVVLMLSILGIGGWIALTLFILLWGLYGYTKGEVSVTHLALSVLCCSVVLYILVDALTQVLHQATITLLWAT